MTDRVLTLHITEEQHQKIESQAREWGYDTPEAYLLALVEADDDIDNLEVPAVDVKDRFRLAWHEAMTSEGLPAREALANLFEKLKRNAD